MAEQSCDHKEINLLIISMSKLPKNPSVNYYTYNKEAYFCGVSQLEAGTKSILRVLQKDGRKIDKIFIVESELSRKGIKANQATLLSYIPGTSHFGELNAVNFYKERIIRYINGDEVKYISNDDTTENKSRNVFQRIFSLFKKQPDNKSNTGKPDNRLQVVNQYESKSSLLSAIYPKPETLFEDVHFEDTGSDDTANRNALYKCIFNLCNDIQDIQDKADDGTIINLFLDMQGARRYETFIINAAVKMLETRNIKVEQSVAIDYDDTKPGGFQEIIDATNNDRIFDMVSGMNEFIQTGRGDVLLQFINESEEFSNEGPEEDVINAIRRISDDIYLCNMDGFNQELRDFKDALITYKGSENKNYLFRTFISDLYEDYNKWDLFNGNDVINQINWCLEKKLYQQALTLVEAKTPDLICDKVLSYGDNHNDLTNLLNKALDNHWKIPSYVYTTDGDRKSIKNEYLQLVWVKYALKGDVYYEEDDNLRDILQTCNTNNWPLLPQYITENDINDDGIINRFEHESFVRQVSQEDSSERRFVRQGVSSERGFVLFCIVSAPSMHVIDEVRQIRDSNIEKDAAQLLISYNTLCDIRNNVNHSDAEYGYTTNEVADMIKKFVDELENLCKDDQNYPIDCSEIYVMRDADTSSTTNC